MTTNAETSVRRAYHAVEGNVMDLQGFAKLFTDDGVIHAGQKTYRGEELTYVVKFLAKLAPDVQPDFASAVARPEIRQTFNGARLTQPEEVANGALFVASDENPYVTGIDIVVDDGMKVR